MIKADSMWNYFLLSSILLEWNFIDDFYRAIFFCLEIEAFIAFGEATFIYVDVPFPSNLPRWYRL